MTDRPPPGVERWIARFAIGLGLLALLVMVVATLLAVLARYFQVTGLEWSYEVAGLAFIWVTCMGVVVAEADGENAAFDVLKLAAPRRLRAALDDIAALVLGGFGAVLLLSSVAMLQRSAFVPTPLLRLPGFVMSGAAPVLGICLIALAVRRIVARGMSVRRPT
jgi:TRAP-type C4-dicarboxylate transport system permease small subunit